MGRTKQAKNQEQQNCPLCSKPMNICREETGLYYCQECYIHVKNGVIKGTDINGEYQKPLGHALKLVNKDETQAKPQSQNIDIYFASGDKKCFCDVIGSEPRDGWMVLTKKDGKEIAINAKNINYMEQI
jgi:ribosomal protein L37AE/L43A